MTHVERLLELAPDDPVGVLSFAELVIDGSSTRALMERVVALTSGVENRTSVETATLRYRGVSCDFLQRPWFRGCARTVGLAP